MMEHSAISLDDQFKKSDLIVFRYVAGEAVLVPISAQVADLNAIFALNETAARIWELLEGKRTLLLVVEMLVEEYEVSPQEAAQETLRLVNQLVDIGALVKM